MSNITKALLLSVVAFGLVACESNPPKEAPKKVADCTYPSSPDVAAPDWVCTGSVEGVEVSAQGSERIVQGEVDAAQTFAMASARQKLAAAMKTRVQAMVTKYVGTTGAGSSATMDKVNESVTRQITDATLEGGRLIERKAGREGAVYVWGGMESKQVRKAAETAVKTSMNNDQALWQQFKAKNSKDEMAAEIAKQKVD
mgnify:CR=1 FL=1